MDYGLIGILVLATIIGFLLRTYLLIKYGWAGKDSFYILIVGNEIRKENQIPHHIDRFYFQEELDYPPFLPWLVSKFDKRHDKTIQYLSPFSDILMSISVSIITYSLFGETAAFFTLLLLLFSPPNWDLSFSLTPRSPGNLFLVISILSLIISITGKFSIFLIVVSILFAAFVLLTHRLTAQSMVVSFIALGVITVNALPFIVILISITLAIILSKGYYLKVLRGHARFLNEIWKSKSPIRKKFLYWLKGELITFSSFPALLLFVILMVTTEWWASSIQLCLLAWGISLILLSVFWPLGQGGRHFANSTAGIAIMVGTWVAASEQYYLFSVILSISIVIILLKIWRSTQLRCIGNITDNDAVSACLFVKSRSSPDDVVLSAPLDFSYNVAYFSGCKVMQGSGGNGAGLIINKGLHSIASSKGGYQKLADHPEVSWVILPASCEISIMGKEVFKFGKTQAIKMRGK